MLSGWDVQFRGHENFGVAILENFFPKKLWQLILWELSSSRN